MIETWSAGHAAGNMDEDILVDLGAIIAVHPWWQARARLALAILRRCGIAPPARVLDAGCGWGTNLRALEAAGYQVTALDISARALERLDGPDRRLVVCDLTQDLPPCTPTFDAVLSLDVIEHLDDDAGAVSRLATLVRPGGVAVLSVPALPELYSEFDQVQGHRRRYVPETLCAAFAGSGLCLTDVYWWGAWMVPVLSRRRKRPNGRASERSASEVYRQYLTTPRWPLSLGLRLAFQIDHGRTLAGRSRTGTSLVAVAVRNATAEAQAA